MLPNNPVSGGGTERGHSFSLDIAEVVMIEKWSNQVIKKNHSKQTKKKTTKKNNNNKTILH